MCLSFFLTIACFLIFSGNAVSQPPSWTEVAPGVWKAVTGNPGKINLFDVAGIKPRIEALQKMESEEFPISPGDIYAESVNGKVHLRFPLEKGEQLYGFGLNFKTVHQRGKILNLHMDHYGGTDNGRTHAPVPFYVSSLGYGIFVNSAEYLTVYAGTAVRKDSPDAPAPLDRNNDKNWTSQPYSDAVEILVPGSGVEIYVFAGPTALDAVRRYNLYSGGGCLPPRWGLGFTQRVPRLYTSEQVEEEAEMFSEKGFPLDFIGLEPGWQSKSYPCTLEWDSTRFPDPAGFVRRMSEKKIKVNLWTNPYLSPASPIHARMLPFSGSHTVWGGIVPDITIPGARDILSEQLYSSQVSIGISGYKIDEVDGYDRWLWPDVATFPSGNSAIQLRQTYGLGLQKMLADLYRTNNSRTYGLVRASNGGGSSFPFVIYNDYYSHEDFITALINSGYSGVLWTPEVRGSKTGEEWLRRMQTVVFSPMAMINAWSSGTKPWSYPEVETEVKNYALLRMQLIPYLYSEFAKYHFEGIPPFRGMSLEPGFRTGPSSEIKNANLDENPYLEAVTREIRDQYMCGEYLLVAPLFTGQTSRKVVLPEGRWYDFYTGKYAGEGEIITVEPGLSIIPVYVKDGGIIPMTPPVLHAPAPGEKYDLEIRYYGKKPGRYMLYDDDGETFDYERGMYSWREINVAAGRKGQMTGTISKPLKGMPDNIGKVTFRIMTEE
jgi:alpha-glucosidase (family GH31 glycosyl hydrolase)